MKEGQDRSSKKKSKSKRLPLTENAIKVLERRYLKKDESGKPIEKPEDMFHRVSENIAQADATYDEKADVKFVESEFYDIMSKLEFLPNSPTLFNAGRELQELSACFVLPIEDSMDSIFEAIKSTALIHKSGGGTGFSFSRIRPKNDVVKSTKGVSSGPISFMTVFDAATETIKQGGTRRGANMAILRVDHPDIMEFITCKEDNDKLNNFNISVGMTEEFMKAVADNRDYDLVNPRTKKVVESLNAKKVFDKIAEMAWKNGEPGIVFLDRLNRDNPTPKLGEIESTNPCGEQPLLPYESCNLGSINLSKMVTDKEIDWKKLEITVKCAVHFLDNVITMNHFPLDKIKEMTEANRKIGLGLMGFADTLIMLDIPYNSNEAIDLAEKLMSFISKKAKEMSAELAVQRGPFPNFEESIYNVNGQPKLRNATTTTIAPTGSIGIIAGCSSGIEPLFAISYIRANVLNDEELIEVNPLFEKIAKERGFYSKELMAKIAKKGSVQGMDEVPENVQKIFVTALDITPKWHIRMQAAFQKYVDNAVSKTVNFPNSATTRDIKKVYQLAYELGCKGVTVYRDGSREKQVLNIGSVKGKPQTVIKPRPRPMMMQGTTMRIDTGCGKLYVTINEDEQGLFEVFAQMGKSGGCAMSQSEAVARLISLALRAGVDKDAILKQLRGIRCPAPLLSKGGVVLSCPDAMSKAIERHIKKKRDIGEEDIIEQATTLDNFVEHKEGSNVVGVCPDCGGPLIFEEGCSKCLNRSCGYTKCG
ncbi:MAG: vitamin B12-dependent ribonucleotide reductase [Thermoplasmata archaeon]|nr:MAG: vitamin B12-dependent ribonucleotide reductase [Thermoplasmata archaeon]